MGTHYESLSDIELLKLYKTNKDLTAYKILLDTYQRYAKTLAAEIVHSFRPKFYPDYNELVQIGIFSFDLAVRNFNESMNSLKAYWHEIAKNEMMNEAIEEQKRYRMLSHFQIKEERNSNTKAGMGFSSGEDVGENLLLNDIISFLENPLNGIKPQDARLFLDYLETPDYHLLAERYNVCLRTVKRKIDIIRHLIIVNVLGEDI